jgi:hypothetical protein
VAQANVGVVADGRVGFRWGARTRLAAWFFFYKLLMHLPGCILERKKKKGTSFVLSKV